MSAPKLKAHPRFVEFREILTNETGMFDAWSGTIFRFQTIDYPTPKDILSGDGAKLYGGRWNAPGIAVVYGSTSDTAALEECKANDHYYGVVTKGARIVVAIETKLERVLNLRKPKVRQKLGLSLEELKTEDWRKLVAAGRESLTQALARAVFESKGSALLARSAAVPSGVNVVVFPRNLKAAESLHLVDQAKLSQLTAKKKN